MNQILATHGAIEKGDETKVDEQPAIPLTDTTQGGTLYVATTGPAYPLELAPGNGKGGLDHVHRVGPADDAHAAREVDRLRQAHRRLTVAGLGRHDLRHPDRLAGP